jgi:hypothetical protein
MIEFRYSDGSTCERTSLGGSRIEFADNAAGREQRMLALGCPADLAKRAAGRQMRALAPQPRASSLHERIAAINKIVAEDVAAGRLLDATTQARIAAVNKIVAADKKAGLV